MIGRARDDDLGFFFCVTLEFVNAIRGLLFFGFFNMNYLQGAWENIRCDSSILGKTTGKFHGPFEATWQG
jgi:hypothetical protein